MTETRIYSRNIIYSVLLFLLKCFYWGFIFASRLLVLKWREWNFIQTRFFLSAAVDSGSRELLGQRCLLIGWLDLRKQHLCLLPNEPIISGRQCKHTCLCPASFYSNFLRLPSQYQLSAAAASPKKLQLKTRHVSLRLLRMAQSRCVMHSLLSSYKM